MSHGGRSQAFAVGGALTEGVRAPSLNEINEAIVIAPANTIFFSISRLLGEVLGTPRSTDEQARRHWRAAEHAL
jgi:hypothetical protein